MSFAYENYMETIKCVVLGDSNVGKTCLIKTFYTGQFPEEKELKSVTQFWTVNEVEVELKETAVRINICDILVLNDGQKQNFGLLQFVKPDVFLLCFSVDSLDSFLNIENHWIPEIRHFCRNTPYLILGTKMDIREGENTKDGQQSFCIKQKEGMDLAKKLKVKYIECSAKTQTNLTYVFEETVSISRSAIHTTSQCHII